MLNLLDLLVKFVWEAIQTHAASEEGKSELTEILDYVDNNIVDIPWYEPSTDGETGDTGGRGDEGFNPDSDAQAAAFRERHPELYKVE